MIGFAQLEARRLEVPPGSAVAPFTLPFRPYAKAPLPGFDACRCWDDAQALTDYFSKRRCHGLKQQDDIPAIDPNRLYFAAGPDEELQGLFGYITK